jgi:hypothetical protein
VTRGSRTGLGRPVAPCVSPLRACRMDGMDAKTARRCAAGLVPLLAACYTQGPLTAPVPAPGTRIVAQVTDSGVVALSNALGPGAVEVEGEIAAAQANSWDLRVVRVDYRGGTSVLWNRELVSVPRSMLVQPIERRFNKRKSWFAAGLITATALLAARLVGVIGPGENIEKPPPPPN